MRGAWSTLALVAVALGLGAYIYFVDSERPDTEAKAKVFAVEADAIEELRVVAKGDTSVLRKTDGAWKLTAPLATDADDNEATALANNLSSLEVVREVDPKASDLAQYGLATPRADISFTAKNNVTGRLRLGDTAPAGSEMYAAKGDESRVFLVAASAETSLVRSAFDLRDKRVLRFERDQADGVEIVNTAGGVSLSRTNSEWRVAAAARGDYGAIEGLLTRVSTTMMSAIEATDVAALQKYGLDKPAATLAIKAGSATASLAVGSAAGEGKVYARDLARPMVFTMDSALLTELQKGASDYRKKDVFDFRPFSARQVILTRGADTLTFAKKDGGGENGADAWTVSGPGSAAARAVDTTAMEDALTKLSGLRASSFDAKAPAGTMPIMKVSVQFEENKKEEASAARAGADVVMVRPDEAGAMRVDASAMDEAMKAFDTVIAPPPPAPATPAATPPPAPEKKP